MLVADRAELPALIGRDRESEALRAALHRARDGEGGTFFLVGPNGSGKSRLVLEAVRQGRLAGMTVLLGRTGSARPAEPLRPLIEALAPLFRAGAATQRSGPRLSQLILSGLTDAAPLAADGPAAPSAVLLGEEVLRLLSVAGVGRGCLLALEDLHDADPRTLAVLEYLVDNLAGQGILVLATLRRDPRPAWQLAQALSQRCSGTILSLRPLDRDGLRLLAAAQLDLEPGGVPEPVTDRLSQETAGNPFLAGELLRAMRDSGALVVAHAECRLAGETRVDLPQTVLTWVAEQVERLGPVGRLLLTTAAVIGERFPISVLGRALRVEEDVLLAHLRAAVNAALVTADDNRRDWYAFANTTLAVALLGQLTPADQAATAQRLVAAVRELHPGLPGEWSLFAAHLAQLAGNDTGAARLFMLAGRRVLHGGRPRAATELLIRAWQLAGPSTDGHLRGDVLHELLFALAECGDAQRALPLLDSVNDLCHPAVPLARLAAVHVQFARLTRMAGWISDAAGHIETARMLLGPGASERQTAGVDAVAAALAVEPPERSARLAAQAVEKAERVGLPAVACLGWQTRGLIARRMGTDETQSCFKRMQQLSDHHHLPLWRTRSLVMLAETRWLETGDAADLATMSEQTWQLGAQALHHRVACLLAWNHALRAEYDDAERLIAACTAEARRLGLADSVRRLSLIRALCAAHRGRRAEMQDALAAAGADRDSPFAAFAYGMARAVCALLEDDEDGAVRELDQAARLATERPGPCPLAGRHGLGLLLAVLRGDADWARWSQLSAGGPARLHWNRQFILLAKAVLLGRRGDRTAAAGAVAAVRRDPRSYPVVIHLGLCLVAAAAQADRWGEPVTWLREAEQYFTRTGVPVAARACRARLRRLGVVVPHRRDSSRVPEQLRLIGLTEREYEVLQLMADWSDNRGIAAKLFISPRTVEKHVASLIAKTEQENRTALLRYAARILGQVERADAAVSAAEEHRRIGVGPDLAPDRGAQH